MKIQFCRWLAKAVYLSFIIFSTLAYSDTRLSATKVNELINQTLIVFSENYIDANATQYVSSVISSRLEQGVYKDITTLTEFAEVVGRDIRNISGDVHLSLMVQNPNKPLTHILPSKSGRFSYNHAFEEVKYIYGNIGYLKLNKFDPAENALRTADTAFSFLQNSDGLIIDLRDTIGGSPKLVQHMLSYFFDSGTVLWTVEKRDNSLNDIITVEATPVHKRFMKDFPVWLLTSQATASASELFAGVLQDRGKAKVIGGVTAGAGFYVGVRKITDELTFRISLAKPTLPISGENWEKKGIQPDFHTDPIDAFDAAFAKSLGAK